MDDFIDIILVEIHKEPRAFTICEAPYSSVSVDDEVEYQPGIFGKVLSVVSSLRGETIYRFLSAVNGTEDIPKSLGKKTYTSFDRNEECAS